MVKAVQKYAEKLPDGSCFIRGGSVVENVMVLWLAGVALSVFSVLGCKPIVREEPASEEQYINAVKRMRYMFRNLIDNGEVTQARDIFKATLYRKPSRSSPLLLEQLAGHDGTVMSIYFRVCSEEYTGD